MKISQLSTDQALDRLCQITPYITSLLGDKALMDELGKTLEKDRSLAELYTFSAGKIAALTTIILQNHKQDLYAILAVLYDSSPEAIENQSILNTLAMVRDAVRDKDLLDFFKSWGITA